MVTLKSTDPSASVASLVEQAKSGSAAEQKLAFSALVGRYETSVRNLLRQLCRNQAIADELAQDAFLTAWLKLDSLQNADRFGGWIKQIAYREFLHGARRAKLEKKYLDETVFDLTFEPPSDDDDVAVLLEVCSPIEREMMILQFGFEFTQQEIAASRGMAVSTVKSHVYRARQKIRRHVERSQDLEECHHG